MPSYRRESTRRDENHVSAKETRGHLSTIPFSLARRKWRERKNLFRGKKYIVVLGGVFALPIHWTRAKKKQGGTRTAGVIVRCSSFFFFFFFLPSHVHTTRIYFSFFPFSPYDPFSFRGGAARSSLEYERLFLGACTVLTACQCFRRRTWCLCQLAVGIRRPSTRHVGCRFFAVASETND